ncbi:MAG: DUF4350 domain-containing protein [Kofleriaceae bacterium]|nr:DUF4350 domain-containing protein [Kofleriaceae bacterium]
MRALVLAAAFALAAPASVASAQAEMSDYNPRSQDWNGLATLVGLVEGQGYTVDVKVQLEWGELTRDDILVFIYPLQQLEPSKLGAFVQAGGNVLVADDFGRSQDALAALGILRTEIVTPRAMRYQDGRMWAPIATPKSDHPLAKDLDEVVTNHPAALGQVSGATVAIGFEDSAVVVAGERGTGRFVAVSDPSIFINRMLQYPGNVQLAVNILEWLDRRETGTRAKKVTLVIGDVSMYGDPPPFIADPRGGKVGHAIDELNYWLFLRREWLLTPGAMKALAATLAALLLLLAVLALPVRRGPRIDGAWLRFGRPLRRDEPSALVTNADAATPRSRGSHLVLACILRDQVQQLLADTLVDAGPEPLYSLSENQLASRLTDLKGSEASRALSRVYRRLRALPSRGQAAAPWSSGHLARRDFDALYRDVADLCRTLGSPLSEADSPQQEAA